VPTRASPFKQLQGRRGRHHGHDGGADSAQYASDNELNFKTLMSKDQFESFLMLESGRVDAFVLDDNMLAGVIGQSKNSRATRSWAR
jgi:glutamate/aspartate transport system substrate-binding protein